MTAPEGAGGHWCINLKGGAMDAGYIIKYGRLIPGREEKAFELFNETIRFWQDLVAKGEVTFFEPYLYASGDFDVDLGFFIVKGPEDKLRTIVWGEEHRMLLIKGSYVVDHLTPEWLLVGEEVMVEAERSLKVAPEFAFVH